ncbi:Holocytochrome c-type synthase [Madurella fahalii]|uniref:Holocytochrome c-type synthase n=1 Tax=Madurella fahalii TaxID=1157608 RepID=A0ABQ0GKK8_9PEZI
MQNDLIDTVLVSRKEATLTGDRATNTTSMKHSGLETAQAVDEAKCPVDHKTREVWLQQARSAPSATTAVARDGQATSATIPDQTKSSASAWPSWLRLPSFSRQGQSQGHPTPDARATPSGHAQLDDSRVISSIPRSSDPGPSACPVNHEQETGTSTSGHWVYPSEKQFFEAMKRKGYNSASAADMKTVVPIHNAVNERAWAEILKWEAPYVAPANKGCGGPRLHSFEGLSQTMSPRARINTLLGYTAPFDRHDWVVDRCGTRVEYIIDFYAGRNDGAGAGKLNFYLDVRPKLNTWEGIRMRALRATGLA